MSAATRRVRSSVALIATAAMLGIGLLAAPSAGAATINQPISCTATNTYSQSLAVGDVLDLTRDNTCASYSSTSGTGIWTSTYVQPNNSVRVTAVGPGTGTFTFKDTSVTPTYIVTVNLTVTAAASSSIGSSTPSRPVTIAFGDAASGANCRQGTGVEVYVGEWQTLPGQGDCTLASQPTATFLGWATTAGFPVTIAQRQTDHGWGTYEMANDAGQVTAVFIPAGHQTLVTGSTTLHPIWAR